MPDASAAHTRTVLLVLGMHRSGTSLLSGLIAQAGVDLGKQLMPAAEDNPRGFWENQALVDLHETILNQLGQTWASWEALPPDWTSNEACVGYCKRLSELLDQEFGDSSLFCIKDPRLCRLLPLWLQVFEERGIRPVCLIVGRPVAEVAASLSKRDGLGAAHARATWLRYNLDLLEGCAGLERVSTSYDELLQNPQALLDSLGEYTEDPLELVQAEFVDPSLHHHHEKINPEDAWATPLYDHLRGELEQLPVDYTDCVAPLAAKAAELEQSLADARTGSIDMDEAELNSAREQSLFAQAQEAKQYANSLQEELTTGREFIDTMKQELDKRQAYALSMEKDLALRDKDMQEKETFIASLQQNLLQKEQESSELSQSHAEDIARREEYTLSLRTHLDAKEKELADTNQLLEERTRRLQELQHRFRFLLWLGNTLRGKKHSKDL